MSLVKTPKFFEKIIKSILIYQNFVYDNRSKLKKKFIVYFKIAKYSLVILFIINFSLMKITSNKSLFIALSQFFIFV